MTNNDKKNKRDYVRQGDIEYRTSMATGVPQDIVKTVFDRFWLEIISVLERGGSVQLHGKGRFYSSKRSERLGRNPVTGESYEIPEREAIGFQVSPAYAKQFRKARAAYKKNNAGGK